MNLSPTWGFAKKRDPQKQTPNSRIPLLSGPPTRYPNPGNPRIPKPHTEGLHRFRLLPDLRHLLLLRGISAGRGFQLFRTWALSDPKPSTLALPAVGMNAGVFRGFRVLGLSTTCDDLGVKKVPELHWEPM